MRVRRKNNEETSIEGFRWFEISSTSTDMCAIWKPEYMFMYRKAGMLSVGVLPLGLPPLSGYIVFTFGRDLN